jgi:hypothetical protein
MAKLKFTPLAEESIRELPKDKILLKQLWRELERIADDLEGRTEFPPPFPHRQDRRLAYFFSVEAGDRTPWGFSVTLAQLVDGVVTVHSLRGNVTIDYPPTDDDLT